MFVDHMAKNKFEEIARRLLPRRIRNVDYSKPPAELKVIQDHQPPEERTSAMNRFRDGVCLCTPFGYHVQYFTDLNFCLCPHDAPLASGAYNPRACAHWLVSEGFELLFEPGWQQLEIPEL